MHRKRNRLLLVVVACSLLGVILGGTASYSETVQCLGAKLITSNCLSQEPFLKTLEGMGSGMLAGAGAAIGATWYLWRRE